MGTSNDGGQGTRSLPKAMRHKQILDIAAAQPDASLDAIADEVPSATADLVEHVLEEYGDPAMSEADTQEGTDTDPGAGEATADPRSEAGDSQFTKWSPGDAGDAANADAVADPDDPATGNGEPTANETATGDGESTADGETDLRPAELTDKQRAVLRAIADRPQATQRELGEELGISAATVSTRVNNIEGFDWHNRQAIGATLSIPSAPESDEAPTDMTANESEPTDGTADSIDQLHERMAAIERQLDELTAVDDRQAGLADPELLHKVLRACFESESLSEDEELQLVKELLHG